VRRISGHGCRAIDLAFGVYQLKRIQEIATLIALVTTSVLISTTWFWASSLNEAVGKKGFMFLAVRLDGGSLLEEPVPSQTEEGVLNNICLLFGCRSPEVVEGNVKPIVNGLVLGVELVTQRLRRDACLECPSLSRSTWGLY